MRPCLRVVGLGPAGIGQLTLESYRMLKKAERVFVRTIQHPCVQELAAEGVRIVSFDSLYENKATFEEVYEDIVQWLSRELKHHAEVIYAVPGHPSVAEKSVKLILDRLSEKADIQVYAAVSFLDQLFSQVHFDPIDGLLVRDHGELEALTLTGKEWLVIPQVYDKMVASEVKLDLMRLYPDEWELIVVKALGTVQQKVMPVPLYKMDYQEFDHLTTVVVPPCSEAPSIARLSWVMAKLREPEGCPWDREQSHDTLKKYLLEESYEVLDAIDSQDMYNLCEELGDLLLQVIFHSRIAFEKQEFDLVDVIAGIIDKMIRRHPHVFAGGRADTADEVVRNWERIKQGEKDESNESGDVVNDLFAGANSLPSLMLAEWTQKKASVTGFDWKDQEGPLAKIREELEELTQAVKIGHGITEEFGDVLFALVNLARFLKVDPEHALRQSVLKFQRRYRVMAALIRAEGLKMEEIGLLRMDFYWEKAKMQEKSGKNMHV